MKEFNLDAALNGEPVILRNKRKAFVLYDIRNFPALINKLGRRPLKGIVFTEDEYKYADAEWNESGVNSLAPFDIIGMWEEPKKQINIEDLPKPFKPKDGEVFYYIYEHGIGCVKFYKEDDDGDVWLAENAQCFRTREDAQKWLDFMKGMLE